MSQAPHFAAKVRPPESVLAEGNTRAEEVLPDVEERLSALHQYDQALKGTIDVVDGKVNSQTQILQDHENRIRALESGGGEGGRRRRRLFDGINTETLLPILSGALTVAAALAAYFGPMNEDVAYWLGGVTAVLTAVLAYFKGNQHTLERKASLESSMMEKQARLSVQVASASQGMVVGVQRQSL